MTGTKPGQLQSSSCLPAKFLRLMLSAYSHQELQVAWKFYCLWKSSEGDLEMLPRTPIMCLKSFQWWKTVSNRIFHLMMLRSMNQLSQRKEKQLVIFAQLHPVYSGPHLDILLSSPVLLLKRSRSIRISIIYSHHCTLLLLTSRIPDRRGLQLTTHLGQSLKLDFHQRLSALWGKLIKIEVITAYALEVPTFFLHRLSRDPCFCYLSKFLGVWHRTQRPFWGLNIPGLPAFSWRSSWPRAVDSLLRACWGLLVVHGASIPLCLHTSLAAWGPPFLPDGLSKRSSWTSG